MIESGRAMAGDGCAIAWRLEGPEDGAADAPVVILSNSLGTALEMWAPQVAALSASFRVLRYDTRGHGRSDVPGGAYGLDRLGRDVLDLMDALGIARAHFCGLSLGGMTGQWLGVHAPDRFDRLVLANTAAYMGPPAGWQSRIAAVLDGGMEVMTSALLERWFTPEFRAAAPGIIAPVREGLLETSPAGYAGCCAAIRDMDMRPVIGLIDLPTLVIAGARDPATPPADAEVLAARIAGSQLVTLDAAHLSNIEQSAAFNAALLDFVS
nr:3-oxoadipate enol-lactonase [Novosphingobium sp. UBA1939]